MQLKSTLIKVQLRAEGNEILPLHLGKIMVSAGMLVVAVVVVVVLLVHDARDLWVGIRSVVT